MRIKRKYPTRKKIAIILLASILLIGGTAAALYATNTWPFRSNANKDVNKIDLSEPSKEAQDTALETKRQSTQDQEKVTNDSDRAVAPEPVGSDKADSGLSITNVTQSDTQLSIRTIIPVYTGAGSCVLTLNGPNGAKYTSNAPIQAMSSTSTCAGFDVPLTELQSGMWTATVDLENEKLKGSDTREVPIR